MVGGVKAHEVSSSSHTSPSLTYAGVKCEHTTRISFIHSFIHSGIRHQAQHGTASDAGSSPTNSAQNTLLRSTSYKASQLMVAHTCLILPAVVCVLLVHTACWHTRCWCMHRHAILPAGFTHCAVRLTSLVLVLVPAGVLFAPPLAPPAPPLPPFFFAWATWQHQHTQQRVPWVHASWVQCN
jgi:hypothetical protein